MKTMRTFATLILAITLLSSLVSAAETRKVLIFSANVGMGHESAARAIEDGIRREDPNVEVKIVNIRDLGDSGVVSKLSSLGYNFLVKHFPKIYDRIFDAYINRAKKMKTPGDLGVSHNEEKVMKVINDFKPDVIVCTFNLATQTLAALREKGSLDNSIPVAWIHTDYVIAKYFSLLSKGIDMTFLPHADMVDDWLGDGVSSDHVMATGMPVKPLFYEPWSEEQKIEFFGSVGLDSNVKTVVLSGGAEGVGNYKAIVESIAQKSHEPVQIVAICGRNTDNENKLKKLKLPSNVKLVVEGFIPPMKVFSYVKSSDVYITKSGGLSPTEAFVIGRPLILLDINGGQERYNSRFFKELGIALVTDDQTQVGSLVDKLFKDETLRQRISSVQAEFRKNIDLEKITKYVFSKLAKSKAQPARECSADLAI